MLLDVVQDKTDLQVSYWGQDGKTHIEVFKIKDEDQFLWLTEAKDKKDELMKSVKNWNGAKVYKHRVNPLNPKEQLNRYRLYEIIDQLPEDTKERIFSYNIPEMFYLDIENKLQDGKPDPENPNKPITVIGVCCPNNTIMVLSGGKNLNQKSIGNIQNQINEHFKEFPAYQFKFVFKYFETEYDLLYFFFSKLMPKMALITGWNVEDYDWRYLYNRAKLIGIDPTLASPARRMTGAVDRPCHVGIVDALKAYKKWTHFSNENYKLDYIGEQRVGVKKVQHSENLDDMYNNNFEKYVYYNAIDCCLVKLICEKCKFIDCGLTTAWLGHIKAMDCFSTTYIPENLLRQSFYAQGLVLAVSPYPKKKGDGEKYEGAFVKQPVPGLHKFCTCNDYASLYPSLMRQFNIGPETLVCVLDENDLAGKMRYKEKGYIVCASGAIYQKEDGHLKRIITDLYFKRKAYKKTSLKYQTNYADIKDMNKSGATRDAINDYLVKNDLSDFVSATLDEILNYCQTQASVYENYQLGTKVVINGIYGAFGFSGFYFYNKDIAESVTKQGKNAILNAERLINMWASKIWQKDAKTHEAMGIKITKPNEFIKPITRYIDTDSIYSSFYDIAMVTDWFNHEVWRLTKINKLNDQKSYMYVSEGGYPTENDARNYFKVCEIDETKFEWSIDQIEPGGREFCLTLTRVFMGDFLRKVHEKYAEDNGTPNILDFELEAYNEAGIWLAKKKYVKNMTWAEPDIYYESCSHIKATGVEIAQTSSSKWVKEQMVKLVKWIFMQEEFTLDGFVKELTKVKKQFMMQNVETISVNKGMNKYSEYVLSDTDEMETNPKAMVTVQGAMLYNYILNNNEKFKKKYTTLFDADKLCVLYIKPTDKYRYWKKETCVPIAEVSKHPDMYKILSDKKEVVTPNTGKPYYVYTDIMSLNRCEAFSYPAGLFPMDLASNLEIDYNRMFELLVLGPMNRIIVAMGYPEVDINMTYEAGLW